MFCGEGKVCVISSSCASSELRGACASEEGLGRLGARSSEARSLVAGGIEVLVKRNGLIRQMLTVQLPYYSVLLLTLTTTTYRLVVYWVGVHWRWASNQESRRALNHIP